MMREEEGYKYCSCLFCHATKSSKKQGKATQHTHTHTRSTTHTKNRIHTLKLKLKQRTKDERRGRKALSRRFICNRSHRKPLVTNTTNTAATTTTTNTAAATK
mmetsp:Transcript_24895/g.61339  ORF Transcript_24895/g.61339 Transcript_24895/m.61339 type:complete len:103 (-) Transcript_24895:111-419(-)